MIARLSRVVVAIVLSVVVLAGSLATPAALQALLADAANRSGVDRGSLQVLRIESAEWSDGGLGCPQAGQFYPQVITPGWLIEVRGGGKIFEYHTDGGDRFVLCAER